MTRFALLRAPHGPRLLVWSGGKKSIGCPEAIQLPMVAPTKPKSNAVRLPSALFLAIPCPWLPLLLVSRLRQSFECKHFYAQNHWI